MTGVDERAVRERFLAAVGAAGLRTSRSGVHRAEVGWAPGPDLVRAEGAVTRGQKLWNSWGYAKDSHFRFAIPAGWAEAVADRGLAVVGGRLTLWACPVGRGSDGVEVFEAAWVVQGRGFGLRLVRGYLARTGRAAHHAATAGAATRGARRKDRFPPPPKQPRLPLAAEKRRWGHLRVGLADAVMLGLCEAGVRRWCGQAGIDPDAGPVSLADVIAAYRVHPGATVRRFVRRVVEAAREGLSIGSEGQPLVEGGPLVTAGRHVRLGPPPEGVPDGLGQSRV